MDFLPDAAVERRNTVLADDRIHSGSISDMLTQTKAPFDKVHCIDRSAKQAMKSVGLAYGLQGSHCKEYSAPHAST